MKYAKISGTGSYLPSTLMTNDQVAQKVDTSDEWIKARTGIKARHIAADDESAASMGQIAAQQALEAAGLQATDLDLIVVATCTPDKVFPSTACLLQQRLGCRAITAFDVSAACSGFVYALDIANNYIRAGSCQHVLVVGSEVMSRILNWQDRSTCILFGDGAAAMVLSADEQAGVVDVVAAANGELADILFVPNQTIVPDDRTPGQYMVMQGNEVFKQAVRTLEQLSVDLITKHNLDAKDVILVPHQANTRIIGAVAKRLGLSDEQVILTIAEQGNTSSASIGLALDAAIRDGRIQRGQALLFASFGGGLTWGAALIIY